MDHAAILASRSTYKFPISAGTSLALEGLAGIHDNQVENPPSQPPILDYPVIWVNLRTMFRNLYDSVDKEHQQNLPPDAYATELLSETETFTQACLDYNKTIKVFFYANNYPDLLRRYPHALFRTDNTVPQKHYAATMVSTLELVMRLAKQTRRPIPFLFRGDLAAPHPAKSLLMTNYAWDLTSAKGLGETDLLESNTGRIKPPSQWYTKYYNGKDYPMIPFRRGFLPVFGDSTLFRPFPKPSRDAIVEIATRYQWSNVTSNDRLRLGLDQLEDKFLKAVVLSMMN